MLGEGVEEDLEKAVFWLTKAAEQGDADSMYLLALCCDGAEGSEEMADAAAYWLGKAAEQGHPRALYELATCFYKDDEDEGDIETAISLLNQAAEGGEPDAQYDLAVYLFEGEEIEKDTERAVYWFRKAAEQGHEEAMEFIRELDAREQARINVLHKLSAINYEPPKGASRGLLLEDLQKEQREMRMSKDELERLLYQKDVLFCDPDVLDRIFGEDE